MTAVTASARKSLGEFKPIIVYPNGKTEVCEQSPERANQHTKYGVIKGNRMARGTTYKTREEAIAAAQAVIDARRDEAIARREHYAAHGKMVERITREIKTWGGK